MITGRVRNGLLTMMLAGALSSGSACSGKKNTEIIVAVQTDLRVPKDLDAITLRVLSRGAVQHEETHVLGPFALRLPATIGLVPADDGDLQPIEVQVIGRFSKDPQVDPALRDEKVLRKARLTFARGRVGLVRLPLKFSCYDVTGCKEAETCIAGACVPTPLIEGTAMPDYSAEAVFGPGGNEQQQGTCFDAQSCLTSAVGITATDDPCVYSLAGAPAPDGGPRRLDPTLPINVSLATAPGGLGFCDATACRVPLDLDPLEGWTWLDETKTGIRLSQGICAKVVAAKGTIRVEATDACATKTPEIPLCAESPTDAGEPPDGSVVPDSAIEPDASLPDTTALDSAAPDSTLPDSDLLDSTFPDTAVVDSAPVDSTLPDTFVPDTFVPDTFVPDTFVLDTFVPDTFVPDTFVPPFDTGVTDTSVEDTSIPDTSVEDTWAEDTFVATDTWVEDTWVEDTWVPTDTWVADTWVADTWVADTWVGDTFVAETGAAIGDSAGPPITDAAAD